MGADEAGRSHEVTYCTANIRSYLRTAHPALSEDLEELARAVGRHPQGLRRDGRPIRPDRSAEPGSA